MSMTILMYVLAILFVIKVIESAVCKGKKSDGTKANKTPSFTKSGPTPGKEEVKSDPMNLMLSNNAEHARFTDESKNDIDGPGNLNDPVSNL